MTARAGTPAYRTEDRAGSRMFDGFTLWAVVAHCLLGAVLLFEMPLDAASGLEGGGLGGGSQMMELTLGGPGGKRAAPSPTAAQAKDAASAPSPMPPQAREVKPDAKAVSARKRDTARQPKPAERTVPQPAHATPTAAPHQPAMEVDAQGSPTASGELEGTAPGSGGTDKGVAFGAGGGTGGGSSGKSGPGGEGFGADGQGGGDGYDRKPRALFAPRPPYPAEARSRGVEGMVVVRLRIDTKGRVVSSHVVGGEATDMFADTTLATVERWRFRPCGRDGRDVACEVEMPVVFQMAR